MINEHLTRQMDIIPLDILGTPITIIGAGAIGSWVTLALAKMGFENLTVWDFDKVDTVNLNSQFYPRRHVGLPKVTALRDLVHDFTGVEIKTYPVRYEPKGMTCGFPGIVISAVDSMEVRKLIWENHRDKAPSTKAVIDPRMGAETAWLGVFNPMDPKDQEAYEKAFYSDQDAVQERCTAKATIYTANMLSGLVCKAVKDVLTKPDYLRIAQWDIAHDQFFGFQRKVG